MAEGDLPFAGTQIAPDGKRYDKDEPFPDEATEPQHRQMYQVYGTPAPGDLVWWDPTTERLEFTDFDTASAFVPSSS